MNEKRDDNKTRIINKVKKVFKNWGLLFLVTISLVVVFHSVLNHLFDATIVKYAFSYISSEWYYDLVFIINAIVFLSITLYRIRRRYIPNGFIIWFIFGMAIYYAFYRFGHFHWAFTHFYLYDKVYYADILLFIAIVNVAYLFRKAPKRKSEEHPCFFNDEPISSRGTDLLGYKAYAEELASKLKNSNFNNAFAIGVNGKWGVGKTSFINMLKEHFGKEGNVLVDFNPWKSSSPDAIVKDFFVSLSEALSPYHSTVTRLMAAYAHKIVHGSSSSSTQIFQLASNFFHNPRVVDDLYSDINSALKSVNRKVIVFIDDVDRLDYNEILEVLKLIRNTANFRNTIFVVAYDRDYLVRAIHEKLKHNEWQFLEKIFQLEINLPYFNKRVLRRELADKIGFLLTDTEKAWIHGDSTNRAAYHLNGFPSDWFYNMRDINRISNAVILNYPNLKGDVVFSEYFILELLRVKYPTVYELLYKEEHLFFEMRNLRNMTQCYGLKSIENGSDSVGTQLLKTKLQDYIEINKESLLLTDSEISKIMTLIVEVFDIKGSSKHEMLSVVFPSKFERYFAYRLLDGSLPNSKFSVARALKPEEFNNQLTSWIEEGYEDDIVEKLESIRQFDDRTDFENVIQAIFFICSLPSRQINASRYSFISFNSNVLYTLMKEEDVVQKYYGVGNNNEYRNFLLSIFNNANNPYLFHCSFIKKIGQSEVPNIPISKEKLDAFAIGYFRTYCNATDVLEPIFWQLWFCFSIKESSPNNLDFFSPESIEIAKHFLLEKVLDGFLESVILSNPYRVGFYGLKNDLIIRLFPGFEEFESFLNAQEVGKWKFITEFKRFFVALKQNEFKDVAFTFANKNVKQVQ